MVKRKLNKQDVSEVRNYIKSLKKEMSGTGGVGAYSTPNAFNPNKDAEGSEASEEELGGGTAYTVKPSKKKPKSFDIIKINEGSYKSYKEDPSGTSIQKVNKTIHEVNKKLREVSQALSHSIKLKTESNIKSNSYWKRTLRSISKIDERLLHIASKLKKLSE